MLPTIKSGDKLSVIPVNPEEVIAGDIVVFRGEDIICHRIVGKYIIKDKLYFLEKGDNRKLGFVRKLAPGKIIGKVTVVETPEGKKQDYRVFCSKYIKLRCAVFTSIYRLGLGVKNLFFGEKPKGLACKITLKAVRALNYLI